MPITPFSAVATSEHSARIANILACFATATPEEVADGKAWYSTAHTFAVGLSERYGISVTQAAGIIAALSPRLSWDLNLRNADTLVRTGDVGGLRGNVVKAQRILAGEHPDVVLGGNKVRSFFDNILRPEESTAVTIDRHAWDIADGDVGDDKSRKALERKGVYQALCDAYIDAAAEVGLAPHVVQAVTWVAWRRRKVA